MAVAQTCPECGTRVSAYAAGCAVCGADLEAYARQRRLAAEAEAAAGGSRQRRVSVPRVSLGALNLSAIDAILLAAALFFALFVPVLGFICAIFGAMHGYYEDRRGLLAAYVVLGLVAAALEIRAIVGG